MASLALSFLAVGSRLGIVAVLSACTLAGQFILSQLLRRRLGLGRLWRRLAGSASPLGAGDGLRARRNSLNIHLHLPIHCARWWRRGLEREERAESWCAHPQPQVTLASALALVPSLPRPSAPPGSVPPRCACVSQSSAPGSVLPLAAPRRTALH